MTTPWTPMRWPVEWRDPSALDLLKGTSVNCLLTGDRASAEAVVARARREGIHVIGAGESAPGVTVIEGEWPGVKLTESGMLDHAAAGPTGVPWIDSNGWKVRLAAALNPGNQVWVSAAPRKPRLSGEAYAIAVADAAAHGGRWILSLDSELASAIAAGRADALEKWKELNRAAGHFAARVDWPSYVPAAIIGVVSDFAGPNEFMSHELLNLLARSNQQYRIIVKREVSEPDFEGLRAVFYADEAAPERGLRKRVLQFVEDGGLLITGPGWGDVPRASVAGADHPRYSLESHGQGRIAVARPDFEDPYIVVNDAILLISHRYELLRFWNGGAVGSCFTVAPDRKHAVVHMLFYAFILGDNRPTVRVVGKYKSARLWTLDQPVPRNLELEVRESAVELHLPPVRGYAAAELEILPRSGDGAV